MHKIRSSLSKNNFSSFLGEIIPMRMLEVINENRWELRRPQLNFNTQLIATGL
jgi:hypothetical protein